MNISNMMNSYIKVNKKEFRHPFTVIGAILCAILIIIFFWDASRSCSVNEVSQIEYQLKETALLERAYVNTYIEGIIRRGKSLSLMLSSRGDFISPETGEILVKQESISDATDIFIYTADGTLHFDDEISRSITDEIDFSKAMNGEVSISPVFITEKNSSNLLALTIPLIVDNVPKGVLTCIYATDRLSNLIDITFFEGQGFMHLFQSDGTFIARYKNVDLTNANDPDSFLSTKQLAFSDGSYRQMIADIHQKKSGFIGYTDFSKSEQYGYYTPVGINDWYIISVVPQKAMSHYSDLVDQVIFLLILKIFFAFLFLLLFVQLDLKKRHQRLLEANTKLQVSEERFRIAVSHTSYLMFEYNFATQGIHILNDLLCSGNLFCNIHQIDVGFREKFFHPDDIPCMEQMHREIFNGQESGSCIVRIRFCDTDENYRWFRMTTTGIFDENGKVIQGVGTLEDIDEQKNTEQFLLKKAAQDPLTGLLNRVECEKQINSYLTKPDPYASHALLLLDLDNFKGLNDHYGHMTGDSVLQSLSQGLRRVFRSSDIAARLGGDEFIIFLPDSSTMDFINDKCRCLQESLQHSDIDTTITFSIGIARSTPGDDFSELYRRADIALYRSKALGKNQISIF